MKHLVLLLGWLVAMVLAPVAMAQEQAWVQIEAQPTLSKATERARSYAETFPEVTGYGSRSGWYVLVLGPYPPAEAAGRLADLRGDGSIPQDAFITDGAGFGAPFWPEGGIAAAPAPETQADPADTALDDTATPPEPADETPKEARASEAEITRDDRKALQESLKWYGFYDGAIDGAFGPGTRNSMAAWQEANGYEPTGILTTLQRATLTANHAADLAEFGFETLTEPEAGIEITLPMALVAFDHYEPPFVHYAEKNGSGLRIMLISEPGGAEALAGLYDILQTLEVVPATGERALGETSFTIQAASDSVQSLAYAESRDGTVKGYLVVWNPADAQRMERILPALKASFRGVGDKALDPGLVPMEDAARAGLLSGLEVTRPKLSRSGFYVDATGHVATTAEAVESCGRVTIDHDTAVDVTAVDATSGIALLAPRAPLAPPAFAGLATASPRLGGEVAIAGYSYEDKLPAPVLTFGTLDEMAGLNGETGVLRLTAPVLPGDAGGPVLDGTGAVIGLLQPAATGDKVLPKGVAFAADAGQLGAALTAAGIVSTAPAGGAALSPDALNKAALGMTVLVSCWE